MQEREMNSGSNGDNAPQKLIRAAQYVRMSTEHQQYSTENQAAAIAEYAAKHGFEIVRTYSDGGKSGLSLDGRQALVRLLEDVEEGRADFQTILVYDVSRWGRFQDPDQAAYLEVICRQKGINVRYCAEQFENDGKPTSTMIKVFKRIMAGEYSRELSVKVFRGQCNLIRHGFRQGGVAGFGLRRMLIDQHGNNKGQLKRGEHKSLQTDRVILVPGPDEEVATVRRIFDLFLRAGKLEREIADILNKESIKTDLGREWSRGTIREILTNEKYIGNNVYNRISRKLGAEKSTNNPPAEWVRADGVFQPVVDPGDFYRVQGIVLERCRRVSDDEMLEKLKALLSRHGKISAFIIDEAEDMPSSSAYQGRFGSLLRAYELVGYTPETDYRYVEINRLLRQYHSQAVDGVVAKLRDMGAGISVDPETDLLTVNEEFTTSIVIARHRTTPGGSQRWVVHLDQGLAPDITIAARMNSANEAPLDYYILPHMDMTEEWIRFAERNGVYLDIYRHDTLDAFFRIAQRFTMEVTT